MYLFCEPHGEYVPDPQEDRREAQGDKDVRRKEREDMDRRISHSERTLMNHERVMREAVAKVLRERGGKAS